jgi:hypothetical protein
MLMKSLLVPPRQRAAEAAGEVDLYLNPAAADVGLLDWGAVDRCARLGYEYATRTLERVDLDQLLDRRSPIPSRSRRRRAARATALGGAGRLTRRCHRR